MLTSFNKNGIINSVILEDYDKVSINKNSISVNPNIFSNTNFNDRVVNNSWDTSINGIYTAKYWGGYNSGVSNPSTVYHAHLEPYENDYVYNYTKNSDNTWLGIRYSKDLNTKLEVNKTYTFSCKYYRISGINYPTGGLYTKANSSATSNTFVNSFSFSNFSSVNVDGLWHYYYFTFTIPADTYMNNGCYFYLYGHTGGSGIFLMKHPKLELGDKPTPWIPNDSDGYGNIELINIKNPVFINNFIEY